MLKFLAKVQAGSSGMAPSGNRVPDLGGFNLLANGPWLREIGRSVIDDPVAPNSDALLAGFGAGKLRIDWSTSTARGGNSLYGIPFNVVPGDQPLSPLSLGVYAKESDPGPAPFFAGMSIESWYDPSGKPPTPGAIKGDHHALVMRRDETSGGIDRLYEYYQVESTDGGTTWQSVGGSQFDLKTGAPRPDGWTSSDAAGLPISPLLVRFDEVARGVIEHPFRVAISPGLSRNRFVWPARHAVSSGSPATGIPMGARLRLKKTWYDANRAGFNPIARNLIDALRVRGVIVADLADGGFWLNGVNDERWELNDLLALRNVPVSAFEVLDTIKPKISFSGPTAGTVGRPQTFTVKHNIPGDSNFSSNIYFVHSEDGGKTWNGADWDGPRMIDDIHRGPLTARFTPTAAGTYVLMAKPYLEWVEPPTITFKAVGRAPRRPTR
jgi:hypothetical protein